MITWKVLKARGAEFVRGEVTDVFEPVGEIDGTYTYSPPAVQAIGEKFGVGSFLLLEIDPVGTAKYVEVTIAHAPATYIEVDSETVDETTEVAA